MKLMRLFAVAALLASSHLVYGQDETDVMSANVPFAFSADGVGMPAGHYVVSRLSGFRLWSLRTSGHRVFLNVTPREVKNASATSLLLFDHQGTSYTLLQVQQQGQKDVAAVRVPKRAREGRSTGQQIAAVAVPAR